MSRARQIGSLETEDVFPRETEALYRCLVEQSLVGVYIHQDERFVYANPRLAEIFGYTTGEILALSSVLDLIVEADRPMARENIRRRVADETPNLVYSARGLRKDGRLIDLEIHGTRASYQGRPAAMGTVLDVTERNRAEAALRDSEARFRALAEVSSVGIFVYQGERFRYVNQTAQTLTGYSREELLAMPVWDVAHPEYRAISRERALARQRGEPVVPRYEMKILTKEGREGWIEVNASAFLYKGQPAVAGAAFDITERKRSEERLRASEERYRAIVDTANEGIWMLDAQGRIEFLNKRLAEMFGYASEEMLGHPVSDFMNEEMLEEAGRRLARCHEGIVQKFDFPFRRKDGSRLWAIVSCTPIPTGGGRFDRALTMLTDVTQRKAAEEALKQSEARLRSLFERVESVREEERSRIAREMHDELGQALTFMKHDLSSLRDAAAGKGRKASSVAEKIDSLIAQVAATIQTVRRLSTELRPVVLDYLGLKAALEWQCQEFQSRTGVPCSLDFPAEDFPLDRDRSTAVFRIFQEILTNVARHARATRIRVSLKIEPEALRLSAEDDGEGIAPAKIADAGSLGLWGMRERVVPFGGSVGIAPAAGGGTRVEVCLPLDGGAAVSESV